MVQKERKKARMKESKNERKQEKERERAILSFFFSLENQVK